MKWQERLNEHEERPRPLVWETLKDRMALQNNGIADKMLNLEVSPPVNAWSGIRNRLSGEENQTKTNQPGLIRRIGRRYASAAAMVASVILLTFLYVRESGKNPEQSANIAAAMQGTIGDRDRTQADPIKSVEEAESIQTEQSVSTPTPIPKKTTMPVQKLNIKNRSFGGTTSYYDNKSIVRIEPGINYIEICGSRTECDRLTYKLEEWAPCIHEAADRGHISTLSSEKERRIEHWRRVLEQSDYIPAAGHFLDILEMASMLSQDGK